MKNNNSGIRGLSVQVRNGNVDGAIRKLKKQVQEDGRLMEVRNRETYEKPTTKRKRAASAARARHLKKMAKAHQDLQQSRR